MFGGDVTDHVCNRRCNNRRRSVVLINLPVSTKKERTDGIEPIDLGETKESGVTVGGQVLERCRKRFA